jgi:hypothetical protein
METLYLNNNLKLERSLVETLGNNVKIISLTATVLSLDILITLGELLNHTNKKIEENPVISFIVIGGIIFGIIYWSGGCPYLLSLCGECGTYIGAQTSKLCQLIAGKCGHLPALCSKYAADLSAKFPQIVAFLNSCFTSFANNNFGKAMLSGGQWIVTAAQSKFTMLLEMIAMYSSEIILAVGIGAVAKTVPPVVRISSETFEASKEKFRRWRLKKNNDITNLRNRISSTNPTASKARNYPTQSVKTDPIPNLNLPMSEDTGASSNHANKTDPNLIKLELADLNAVAAVARDEAALEALKNELDIYICPIGGYHCEEPVRIVVRNKKITYFDLFWINDMRDSGFEIAHPFDIPWPFARGKAIVDQDAKREMQRIRAQIKEIESRLMP